MYIAKNEIAHQVITSTVSVALLHDLLQTLERISKPEKLQDFLRRAGISPDLIRRRHARITHEQLVRLYQIAAIETGDEMMGLWSRPIRAGALKFLCRNVRDAGSISVALYRFTRIWNLLLDDYLLALDTTDRSFGISLLTRSQISSTQCQNQVPSVNRFGHMLMLKLTHGVVSWLIGHEVPLRRVAFTFSKPDFAEDYRVLFPVQVEYDAPCSSILFHEELAGQRYKRPYAELRPFLERAPRDWIFTTYRQHGLSVRVREFLSAREHLGLSLTQTAMALHMSPRTLMRRLGTEQTSFQGIKDGVRRDFAIFDLINSNKSLDDIAHDHGFASVSIFHRAFKGWTGNTPGEYRRYRLTGE
uniref:AraC family transcriptional regulator n=1 Tax=Castellaniella defragrans TaxID=75697 RepID=UPI00333EC0EB